MMPLVQHVEQFTDGHGRMVAEIQIRGRLQSCFDLLSPDGCGRRGRRALAALRENLELQTGKPRKRERSGP